MTLTQTRDIVTVGLGRLLSQYRDRPVLAALISAYLAQAQLTEDMFFGLLEQRLPEDQDGTVTGVQLDVLGRLVGQPRGGRTDAEYIKWIRARSLVNRASGTADELLNIVLMVRDTGTSIELVEGSSAECRISILEDTEDQIDLAAILYEARPAGVRFELRWYLLETRTFQFTTSGATETDASKGFGDETDWDDEDHVVDLALDGDMELAGVVDWPIGGSGVVATKQTASPHGGIQNLRVAKTGASAPWVNQNVLTIGEQCTVKGWARGNGTNSWPKLYNGSTLKWQGTISTTWQYFETVFTPTVWTTFDLRGHDPGSNCHVEFDDIEVLVDRNPKGGRWLQASAGTR